MVKLFLTPPLVIEVPVPGQESERSYICMLGVSILPLSVILELFGQCGIFGIVRTMWYFWNCSDNVVFLELFGQCGIFGIVRTMWYFWNCSDNVVFLELFGQCIIFGIVRTMWYFCFSFYSNIEMFQIYINGFRN